MKKILSLFAAVLFAGSMMAANLLSIDFTQGQGDWTINDVNKDTLSFVWQQTAQYGMKASAYTTAAHATESWLISPAIDLSGVEKATLAFSHARRYGSLDQLSVKASADGENWANLEVSEWPDGTSWNYVDATANLTAYAGQAAVKIAFVYTSSTSGAATWEIKTVTVADAGGVTPEEYEKITVAKALEIGAAVEASKETADYYEITGFVTQIDEDSFDTEYNNMTFWIADEAGTAATNADGAFEVFRGKPNYKLAVGDQVVVVCKIKNFVKDNVSTIETGNIKSLEKVVGEGIQNVKMSQKAQKVVVDGQLYIVRDGKMFNMTGAQVR